MDTKISISLVSYINNLHKGHINKELYDYHKNELENCSAEEVSLAIDNLISRIKDVSRIESTVAKFIKACGKGLDKQEAVQYPDSDILKYLIDENRKAESMLESVKFFYKDFISHLKKGNIGDITTASENLEESLSKLSGLRVHYLKLQNGIFTSLEKSGNNIDCIKLMWFLHDSVLENIKKLSSSLKSTGSSFDKEKDFFDITSFNKLFGEMYLTAASLIYREEKILYPMTCKFIPDNVRKELVSEIKSLGLL